MKKVILTLAIAVAATTSAFAQLGVSAGYVTSKTTYVTGNSTSSDDPFNGVYAEAIYQLPVSEFLTIEPGIRYTLLTRNSSTSGSLGSASVTSTEHYIGVPVMAHFQMPLSDGIKVFAFAGPTLQYGISGIDDLKGSVIGISGGTTQPRFDKYYSPLDMLVGGGAGVEYGKMRLSVGYHYGFLNRNTDGGYVNRDAQLNVGLTYLF